MQCPIIIVGDAVFEPWDLCLSCSTNELPQQYVLSCMNPAPPPPSPPLIANRVMMVSYTHQWQPARRLHPLEACYRRFHPLERAAPARPYVASSAAGYIIHLRLSTESIIPPELKNSVTVYCLHSTSSSSSQYFSTKHSSAYRLPLPLGQLALESLLGHMRGGCPPSLSSLLPPPPPGGHVRPSPSLPPLHQPPASVFLSLSTSLSISAFRHGRG